MAKHLQIDFPGRVTPAVLLQRHLQTALEHLPGVFDGAVESVHQARIATRRMREVLPLVGDAPAHGSAEVIREMGRRLGRVRELDVMSDLLASLSDRVPPAVATVAHEARLAVHSRQRTERRAMVKALERLELEPLRTSIQSGGWRWIPRVRAEDWTDSLWARILGRSEEAAAATRRAPGVYFPRRSHRARVAVKRLRYAVEVATDTGLWTADRVLKDLRRLQTTLGSIHDAQVLLDRLDELVPDQPGSSNRPLKRLLEDDIARDHTDYVKRRDRIFMIAEACERAAARARSRWRASAPLIAVSAIAAPLVAQSMFHRDAQPVRQRRIAATAR